MHVVRRLTFSRGGLGVLGLCRFGSKLAAMAARLQAIKEQGEKAIVFCQWEARNPLFTAQGP